MAADPDLRTLMPAELDGWRGQEDGLFSADTLFNHIDGGAEVYRALNVRRVLTRTFVHPGAPDVLVDVFDMGSAADAFGAYHHDTREDPGAGVGNESELSGGNLAFWKGRYFVSVVALGETAETEKLSLSVARYIAARIQDAGHPPGIVSLLPSQGQVPGHLSYFHRWEHLSARLFITGDNLLDLDAGTEAIAARYRGPATLLVVRYPQPERAERAARRFAGSLLRGQVDAPVSRPGGTWAAARATGPLVVVVWEADSRDTTRRLLDAVKEER